MPTPRCREDECTALVALMHGGEGQQTAGCSRTSCCPEDMNRAQRRITSTNQHPMSMGTK